MNPVTQPFHLLLPTIINLVAVGLILVNGKKLLLESNYRSFWRSTVVFCLFYALIVGGAAFMDVSYQMDLNQYDLDGDGIFGEIEQTEGQVTAMKRLVNDTGRNFAFITGGIFSFILALAAFGISLGFEKYKRLKAEDRKDHTQHQP